MFIILFHFLSSYYEFVRQKDPFKNLKSFRASSFFPQGQLDCENLCVVPASLFCVLFFC